MRMHRTIFLLIALLNTFACRAGTTPPRPQCLTDLGKDSDFTNAVATKIGTNDVQQWITNHKSDFYNMVADGIKQHCLKTAEDISEFNNFLDNNTYLPVKFAINDQWYDFNVTKDNVFDYIRMYLYPILITNTNLSAGSTVSRDEVFQNNNLPNSCALYLTDTLGGADFEVGDPFSRSDLTKAARKTYGYHDWYRLSARKKRSVPGMITYIVGLTSYNVIYDTNYIKAREHIKQLTTDLSSSSCSGQRLVGYIISDLQPTDTNKTKTFKIMSEPFIIR